VSVFVDAVVPNETRTFTQSGRFGELMDTIPTEDGYLAPWHTWRPDDVLTALVPDDAIRTELTADVPRVPRSFYAEPIPVPPRWWRRPAAYLQLSDGYDDERRRADLWGWPTHRRRGHHLDLFTHPDEVVEALLTLVRAAPTPHHEP
jgi:hypothetical protein